MELDLTPRELLTTTRAVRKRLDLERPVERVSADARGRQQGQEALYRPIGGVGEAGGP